MLIDNQRMTDSPFPAHSTITETEYKGASRRFIVMDVDSTLIDEEVIDLIADEARIGEQIAAITAAAMRGELDFRSALAQRVSSFKGLSTSVLDAVLNRVHFTTGALDLVQSAHRRGWKVGVVSGGFHEIVDTLVTRAGIDYSLANSLEMSDGVFTGRTTGPIIDKDAKLNALQHWVQAEGLSLSEAVAIGDGANDIPMLRAAGLGIAFCAKPKVREAADAHLDERDLMKVFSIIEESGYPATSQ